jgi:hypothetical protein
VNIPLIWPCRFFCFLRGGPTGRFAVVLAFATGALMACTGVWSQTVREQVGLLGMTHEQLAPQLVGVQPVRSPRRLSSGAVGSWWVADALCEGFHFEQTLFFARQTLAQMDLVLLQAGYNPAAADAAPARTAYAALVQSLRVRFGAELASSASTSELVMDTASWVSGSADVMLFLSGKSDRPTLRLVIRQRQLVDAGEL